MMVILHLGLDRDRKNNVLIKIINKKETKLIEKKVFKRKYKIQRIDGLPPKQVTPPPEVFDRIKMDNKEKPEQLIAN